MRGTILKKIVALAVAVCLVLSAAPTGVKAADSDGTWGAYLALGDSISSGYGLNEGEQAFPAIVAGTGNLTLDNQAQEGETSATLLAKLKNGALIQNVQNADVITITIGGNDLMDALYSFLTNKYAEYREQSPLPLPEMNKEQIKAALLSGNQTVLAFASTVVGDFATSTEAQQALAVLGTNFASIMTVLRQINPNVWVVVATQYNPYAYLGKAFGSFNAMAKTLSDTFEIGVQSMNGVITSMSAKLGYTVADVYSAFANSTENLCNAGFSLATQKLNLDFHPNAKGHTLIATTVGSAITNLKDTADGILTAEAAKVAALKDQAFVEQADVNTEEAAKSWAENLVKNTISNGVTADVQIAGFQAAKAGTKDDTDGTSGSFQISVTLSYSGYAYGEATVIDAVIQATMYTAPEEEPEKEPAEEETTPVEKPTVDTSKEKEDNKKPVSTSNQKDEEKANTDKAPKTGDTANAVPYVLVMAAAGAVIIVSVSRKKKEL